MAESGLKEGLSPKIRPGRLILAEKLIAFIFYKKIVYLIFIIRFI
jgi:hypothetical protein